MMYSFSLLIHSFITFMATKCDTNTLSNSSKPLGQLWLNHA